MEINSHHQIEISQERKLGITRTFVKKQLIVLALIIFCFDSSAQSNFMLTGGIGFPEMINVGARYQINKVQIGSSFGYFKEEATSISVSGDLFWHLGNQSELSDLPPWFIRFGYNYTKREDEFSIHEFGYLNWRVGRDIYFNRHLGCSIDLMVAFRVYNNEIIKEHEPCYGWFCDLEPYIIKGDTFPGVGFSLFYKI